MQYVYKAVLICVALALSACNAVYTKAPVGETVVQLNPDEWQGTWLGDEMVVVTTVLDAEKGILQAAWIERGEKGATLETEKSFIRASGDFLYANAIDTDAEELRYVWFRVDKSASKLTTWAPNLEAFTAMVKDGRLPGVVIDDDVVLEEITASQLEMINSPTSNLLDWNEPRVFFRITD